jgi:hypothetical protein
MHIIYHAASGIEKWHLHWQHNPAATLHIFIYFSG